MFEWILARAECRLLLQLIDRVHLGDDGLLQSRCLLCHRTKLLIRIDSRQFDDLSLIDVVIVFAAVKGRPLDVVVHELTDAVVSADGVVPHVLVDQDS